MKFVPVMVTEIPPAVEPVFGETPVTVGTEAATYMKWSEVPVEDIPLGVVTVMSMVPALPAGEVAVN